MAGSSNSANEGSETAKVTTAATQNTRLEVVADGSDEEAAMVAICTLIEDQFGERSTTSQP